MLSCCTRPLQEACLQDIEMPGQYQCGEEPSPDGVVYMERISGDVTIVRRHGTSFRRLAFFGSDGHMRHFLVQTGQHYSSGAAAEDCLLMWDCVALAAASFDCLTR